MTHRTEDNTNPEYDENGDYVFRYKWDGKEVTNKKYEKKLVSVLLAGVMTVGMLAGCGSSKGESTGKSKDYDLTLYSVMTTDPDFDEWLKKSVFSKYNIFRFVYIIFILVKNIFLIYNKNRN